MTDVLERSLRLSVEGQNLAGTVFAEVGDQLEQLGSTAHTVFAQISADAGQAARAISAAIDPVVPYWSDQLGSLSDVGRLAFSEVAAQADDAASTIESSGAKLDTAWGTSFDAIGSSADTNAGAIKTAFDGAVTTLSGDATKLDTSSSTISTAFDGVGAAAKGMRKQVRLALNGSVTTAEADSRKIAGSLDTLDGALKGVGVETDTAATRLKEGFAGATRAIGGDVAKIEEELKGLQTASRETAAIVDENLGLASGAGLLPGGRSHGRGRGEEHGRHGKTSERSRFRIGRGGHISVSETVSSGAMNALMAFLGFQLLETSLKDVESVQSLSAATGLKGKQLDQLGLMAAGGGLSLPDLLRTLIQFDMRVNKATAPTKEMAKALAELGISAKQFADANPAGQAEMVASALERAKLTAAQQKAILHALGVDPSLFERGKPKLESFQEITGYRTSEVNGKRVQIPLTRTVTERVGTAGKVFDINMLGAAGLRDALTAGIARALASNSAASRALAAHGIDPAVFLKMQLSDQLDLVARVYRTMHNREDANAFVSTLFGRNSQQLIPLFQNFSQINKEAKKLNVPGIDIGQGENALIQTRIMNAYLQLLLEALAIRVVPLLLKVLGVLEKGVQHGGLIEDIGGPLLAGFGAKKLLGGGRSLFGGLRGLLARVGIGSAAEAGVVGGEAAATPETLGVSDLLIPFTIAAVAIYQHWGAVQKFLKSSVGSILIILGHVSLWPVLLIEHWSQIPGFVEGVWTDVMSFLSSVPGTIESYFSDASTWLIDAGSQILDGLTFGLDDNIGSVDSWFTDLPGVIDSAVSDAANWLSQTGGNLVDGLLGGITGRWSSKVDSWFGGLPAAFKGYFSGASTWLTGAGGNVIGGIWAGISSGWDGISAWFDNSPTRLAGFFRGAASWLVGAGGNVIGGIWSGISSGWTGIDSWFSNMAIRVGGYFSGAATWLTSNGGDVIQSLWNGIKAGWDGVKGGAKGISSWFGSLKSTIQGYFTGAGSWLLKAGEHLISGLLKGIANKLSIPGLGWLLKHVPGLSDLKNAVGSVAGDVTRATQSAFVDGDSSTAGISPAAAAASLGSQGGGTVINLGGVNVSGNVTENEQALADKVSTAIMLKLKHELPLEA